MRFIEARGMSRCVPQEQRAEVPTYLALEHVDADIAEWELEAARGAVQVHLDGDESVGCDW